jgi:5'-nucleotidase
MRVLVTNDDGVSAPGLRALALHLAGEHDVLVAAPLGDRSGASAALGTVVHGRRVAVERSRVGHLTAVGVDAPPALIVRAVLGGALGAVPELVVSGVNPGFNTGGLLLHSGTFGAAATAASMGAVGVAVSAGSATDEALVEAADVACRVLGILSAGRPAGLAVNLNVPVGATGARRIRPGRRSIEQVGFRAEADAWVVERSRDDGPFPPGTDAAAVAANVVGVYLRTLFTGPWPGADDLVRVLDDYCGAEAIGRAARPAVGQSSA